MLNTKLSLPTADQALPGRAEKMAFTNKHYVNGMPLSEPYGDNDLKLEVVYLGLGCFWGAERKYWQMAGVVSTSVGYMGGLTPNPSYEEVCTGLTGHNEVVKVVFDPALISIKSLLTSFFELHDPTQGMRQGNDKGTQYRSGIYYTSDAQGQIANATLTEYQNELHKAGHGKITTEIISAPEYYYAEDYHQQYLAKNPNGYCGIGGTGVTCPI
ncbi:peptide-methionine (S)-S-oxide reductase MsrA [Arenicella sp. 4NH20-0111]|uniref:peptide-methionine (S)-S-oxide reductase MsrA n=1 Tax=Arenicella sp. 4NH20-0111 TaxID=3127648 RepID=UPI0031097F20